MSLYEGKTVTQERPALVFDIGYAYTKYVFNIILLLANPSQFSFSRFGFAAEYCPRCIIPSKITCEKTRKVKLIHEYNDRRELYDNLVDFIQQICFR